MISRQHWYTKIYLIGKEMEERIPDTKFAIAPQSDGAMVTVYENKIDRGTYLFHETEKAVFDMTPIMEKEGMVYSKDLLYKRLNENRYGRDEYLNRVGISTLKNSTELMWNNLTKPEVPIIAQDYISSKRPRLILFDMDGVLAKFNKDATMEEVFSNGYFEGLEAIRPMVDFAETLNEKGYNVGIMSKTGYDPLKEKIRWLKREVPFIHEDNYFFCPLESDKTNFVPDLTADDILLDDYWKNLVSWHGMKMQVMNGINHQHEKDVIDINMSVQDMVTALEDYMENSLEAEKEDSDYER